MTLEPFIEPSLRVDESRFVMFPIKHNDVWELYKKSMDSFWKAEDIDLSRDYSDWVKMTGDEQHFIKMVLAFFAASDGIIIENLISRFMVEIQSSEIRAFYSFQNFMENVHSETYSLLIDTYIKDSDEKAKLFNAIENAIHVAHAVKIGETGFQETIYRDYNRSRGYRNRVYNRSNSMPSHWYEFRIDDFLY